jgi:hypothetical protein
MLSGLFWPNITGGHTEAGAAERIYRGEYWRHYQSADLPYDVPEKGEGNCELELNIKATERYKIQPVFMNLRFSIYGEQVTRRRDIAEKPVLQALAALPYPVLGGLEGCLGRSALSPLCHAYVERLAAGAARKAADQMRLEQAQNDREMEEVWCAALSATRAFNLNRLP